MDDSLPWVLAEEVPEGATIVSEEWRYTSTKTASSSSSSMDGWTPTGKAITSYGPQIGPVYSNPSGNDRKVTSESYISGYNTKHVYRFYKWGYSEMDYSYASESGGRSYFYWELEYMPSAEKQFPIGKEGSGYRKYDKDPNVYASVNWTAVYYEGEADVINYNSPIYSTCWYYQEPIYTYYFKKIENLTSKTEIKTSDAASNETISDIQKWVKYTVK